MRFPEEIVVDKVLPTIRALLAAELIRHGLTQSEVAERLSLSQSAVSKYALGKVEVEPEVATDARTIAAVQSIGAGLADGALDTVSAMTGIMTLVRELENRGPVCRLHEAEVPALRGLGCDLCIRGSGSRVLAEAAVLASLRRGVRMLEATADFARYLPHVGSNLVMALPDARDAIDVAGVLGGLVEVRGRAKAPGEPEFGASRHVAEILLAARVVDASRGAALALAPAAALRAAAESTGLTVRAFPAALDRDPARLAAHLREEGVADVLYQDGDVGVEGIAYLFGADAATVAEVARSLVTQAREHA